jgi:TM2 domain-containing membrane protein YozV
MYCRNCGKAVGDATELCVGCGERPLFGNGFCQECGFAVKPLAEHCVKCGSKLVQLIRPVAVDSSKRRRIVSLLAILPALVGLNGIHRFYLGKTGTGIVMLLTLGGIYVWTIYDFVRAVTGKMKDKEGKLIKNW